MIEISQRLCAELTPNSLGLIESFGLPEEMLQSPIASDWVKYNRHQFSSFELKYKMFWNLLLDQVGYNAYDNQGELQTNAEFQEVLHNTKPDLSMGYSN